MKLKCIHREKGSSRSKVPRYEISKRFHFRRLIVWCRHTIFQSNSFKPVNASEVIEMRAEAQVQNSYNRDGLFFPSRSVSIVLSQKGQFSAFFLLSFFHHQLSYQLFDCRTAELIFSLAQEVSADMKGTVSHVLIQLWDLAAGGLHQEH